MTQELNLQAINLELREKTPKEIIEWALNLQKNTFCSTSFSPNSAALLHMVSSIKPELPIIWVDSGYNVADTYRVAENIMDSLKLNMHIHIPEVTAERRNALMGGIPHPDDDEALHKEFARQVKLEPFDKAVASLKGEVWINGIRRHETDFRKTLDIVTLDNKGIIKVAPLFLWSEDKLQNYMEEHQLPSPRHYFDPTKASDSKECGLHLTV